jgi:putative CocE/NonD family hydrolase
MGDYYNVRMRSDVKVPMRDGVCLSAEIYLPDAPGPFPTVLMRTPYDNNGFWHIDRCRQLANRGYVCVMQDCRGRYDSDGQYYPFRDEDIDGFDTQEWIGKQPWSNGRIGMAGPSYMGWVQISSAMLRSQYLTCISPRVMCADLYSGLVYRGGALQLHVMMMWGMRTSARTNQNVDYDDWREAFRTLPLDKAAALNGRELPHWDDWLAHPTYDDYWAKMNLETKWGEFATPALSMCGWYDLYSDKMFTDVLGMRKYGRTKEARQSRLIVGAWPHILNTSSRTGGVDFGVNSLADLDGLELRWFDYWLKGINNGIVDEAPFRLFIMGINSWRDEYEWPLARTDWQKWYFHSGGKANTLAGDGTLATTEPKDEPADHFIFDPANPVQTIGGNNCCLPHLVPWGAYDQRDIEMRGDVLCYTSAPLEQDVEVTGPIKVILYAATDGRDTDWTGKLVDVRPSGFAMNLCDGILRARYRESFSEPTLLESGTVYRYEIDLMVTGNVFLKGHRIRVEISSSNFPRFDRNLNTGLSTTTSTEIRVAHQTILHTKQYPSHILLPVIPVR